jgi:uncharacterized delta-60 repeat protein
MKSRFSPHPWLIAACLLLAACTGSTTISPGPPTAFGLWRFTTVGGTLDTAFPAGATAPQGFTFTNVVPGGFSFALAAAVQADGKIVVGGSAGLAGQGTVALVRYSSDGTLDSTFVGPPGNPTPGIVQTPLPSPAVASAIAVQPADQKIVVAALTFSTTSTTGIAVLRYKTDGTLDTTFNTTGVVNNATIGPGLATDTCALALQSDGQIVVAGASQNGNIVLYRYSGVDGSPDMAFGTNGSVSTSLGMSTVAMAPSLGLLSDGSIVVATGNNIDQVILHYTTAGAPDMTFGGTTNGIVTTDVGGGQNFANAVAVQFGDKLVVVGHANVTQNTSDISLVRYNANGTLDTSFGPAGNPSPPGIVVTELGAFDNAFSVALQDPASATTNILVSGNTGFGGGQAVVLRYATNGALDTTFNPTNGFAIPPLFGPSTVASGNVVLQTTLGIIVAGFD